MQGTRKRPEGGTNDQWQKGSEEEKFPEKPIGKGEECPGDGPVREGWEQQGNSAKGQKKKANGKDRTIRGQKREEKKKDVREKRAPLRQRTPEGGKNVYVRRKEPKPLLIKQAR